MAMNSLVEILDKADLIEEWIKYYNQAILNLTKSQSIFKSMEFVEKVIRSALKQDSWGNFSFEGDKKL